MVLIARFPLCLWFPGRHGVGLWFFANDHGVFGGMWDKVVQGFYPLSFSKDPDGIGNDFSLSLNQDAVLNTIAQLRFVCRFVLWQQGQYNVLRISFQPCMDGHIIGSNITGMQWNYHVWFFQRDLFYIGPFKSGLSLNSRILIAKCYSSGLSS